MVARNGVSLVFLAVSVCVLLMIAPATVRGDVECEREDLTLWQKVKCGAKKAADQIEETAGKAADKAKEVYHDTSVYVKDKFADKTTTPAYIPDLTSGNTEKPIPLAPIQ